MATATTDWCDFEIRSDVDGIPLRQIERNTFELGDVVITYHGETGLEHLVPSQLSALEHEALRTISHHLLPTTDLASVPGPMRWFTNSYGAHTPAALIHDYLIVDSGDPEIIPATWADRYFRFMLKSCGVPFLKRSIMWTGVALRTRAHSRHLYKKVLLALWFVTALLGMTAFFATAASVVFGSGDLFGAATTPVLLASMVAPLACSAMWEKQALAGLTTAVAAPWLLPAAAVAATAWCVYRVLEMIGSLFQSSLAGVTRRIASLAAFWKIA